MQCPRQAGLREPFPGHESGVTPWLQNISSLPIAYLKTLEDLPVFPASAPNVPFCEPHTAAQPYAALLPGLCWAVSAVWKDAFPRPISLSNPISLPGPAQMLHRLRHVPPSPQHQLIPAQQSPRGSHSEPRNRRLAEAAPPVPEKVKQAARCKSVSSCLRAPLHTHKGEVSYSHRVVPITEQSDWNSENAQALRF